jgi:hypothetical protein
MAAQMLPGLMKMDYAQFYGGSDEERSLRYRLAWSIAYFIEKGAREVRFDPFKDLKRDYIAALLSTRDMHKATDSAFASSDRLNEFIDEWKRYWKKQ